MNSTNSIEDITLKTQGYSVEMTLQFLTQQFPNRVKFSTSFGEEDQVLTDIICRNHLAVKIFTLDTGRLFEQTYALFDKTRNKYQAEIKCFFPNYEDVEKLIDEKGPNSFYQSVANRKECCHIRKVAPLQLALQDADIWVTGLMADQSDVRKETALFAYDAFFDVIKYNPLTQWSRADLENYIAQHNVPTNVLHKQGYPSIGCEPCTRAVEPGEHPRSGRWWWEQSHKECGIHLTQK
ncbi:MAG: phosphoadenylyl-sulfate reductase [Bacteroidetes bacterium]|nr:phosphoadenylyl-sulfate reductase [Bacteroidota bacterium]